jgi:hypothetical protein
MLFIIFINPLFTPYLLLAAQRSLLTAYCLLFHYLYETMMCPGIVWCETLRVKPAR